MNTATAMTPATDLPALPIASPQSTVACLEMARQLAVPHAIIHVGAGFGHGPLSHWQHWPVAHVRVIDSDEKRLQWLSARTAQKAEANDWLALGGVIAEQDGELELHHASNPAENGLLPASELDGLWPNLHPLPSSYPQAQRLDSLLARHPLPSQSNQRTAWLIIECLPALRILQGATQTLESIDVICLRVVLDPSRIKAQEATLPAAATFLSAEGFSCVHIGETNHPAIGEALFLRDKTASLKAEFQILAQAKCATELIASQRQGQIDTLTQANASLTAECDSLTQDNATLTLACDEQTKLAAERQAQIDALNQANASLTAERDTLAQNNAALTLACDEQTKLAAERQAQIDALNQANASLTADRDTLVQSNAALTQDRDEQAKLAAERQTQIDALQQTKAEAEHLASQRQGLIDTLTQENTALTTTRDALTKEKAALIAERDTLVKEKSTISAQCSALQQAAAEGQHRQRLLEEEMIKADAQLELIKDLLLREPGL